MHLSDDERHRIQAQVQAAEARTGVHIATAVVPASDRYALYPLVWATLIALGAGGIIAMFWPAVSLRESFALQAAVFIVLSLVFDWWPIRLRLVPPHVRHAHASATAHREFAARVLATQKGGLLIFVSQGERYAEIIADKNLHARIGSEVWNRIVTALVSSAASGRTAEGVIAAVKACTAEIAARS